MTMDYALKLFDSATKLLGVVVWPAVLVFVVIRFGPALRDFIASMGELTLKGAGFEASAKRKQAEAAAALVAAAVSHPESGMNPEASAGDARAAVQVVTLLDELRRSGNHTPFIIYAGSRAPEHRAEARRRGAIGCTNRPDELLEIVLAVLERRDGR